MNSVTADIKDILVAAGFGTFAATSGWSVNISVQPETPHSTITLNDNGGGVDKYNNADTEFRDELLQIRVRNQSYTAAFNKALQIQQYLIGLEPFTVGTVTYNAIVVNSGILDVGQDESRRSILSMNFRVFRQEAESSSG